MQVRLTVEVFGDSPEILTRTDAVPHAQGIMVDNLTLPKDKPISIRMRNLMQSVLDTITSDTIGEQPVAVEYRTAQPGTE
jgi:hypothetical protein